MPIINMVYKKKKWWKPWANTIAYYPLKWNLNDYSGNGYNAISTTWTITYPDNEYANFSAAYAIFPNWYSNWTITADITISVWVKDITPYWWEANIFGFWMDLDWWWWWIILRADANNPSSYLALTYTWNKLYQTSAYSTTSWVWHHLAVVVSCTNSYLKLYIDWVLKETKSWTNSLRASGKSSIWQLGNYSHRLNGNVSELINERIAWGDTDVANYYNQTKANYWL